jgi:hypothetical protein
MASSSGPCREGNLELVLNSTEQVSSYALTTLQRIKDRLFDPQNLISVTGNTTQNSTNIAGVSSLTNIQAGQAISGAGIPSGAIVTAVNTGTNALTISAQATATANSVAITVVNQPPQFDVILTRLINGVTDFIERECGKSGMERYPNDGHFVQKTYTNELYSVRGTRQDKLVLRNAPVTYLIVTGNLTQGSAVVASVSPTTGIVAGMPLYNIQGLFPQGTTVLSVSGTSVTMSNPASVTQTNASFEISGLISFQWRAGTPSNPNWTSFITDQFELEQQGYSGIVKVYGVMPRIYSNMLRATYVAGFPVDWPNAGDGSTHQLPADLTSTCENIIVRFFKRRQLDGRASEAIQGATTSWRDQLDANDRNVINNYKRVGNIF